MSVQEGINTASNFIARFYNVNEAEYFGPRLLMDNRGSTLTAALDLRSAPEAIVVRLQVESGSGDWDIVFDNTAGTTTGSPWDTTNLNCHSEQFYSFT